MICEQCGRDVQIGMWPFCPHPHGTGVVHGDEIDYIDHNLGQEPVRIRSKAERKRLMAERGLEEANYYVEPPANFEGKPSTQNWAAYLDLSPETLAWIDEAPLNPTARSLENLQQ